MTNANTIREYLKGYAHIIDFRLADAEHIAGWRRWDIKFRTTFAKVNDADLMAAIKANLPALTAEFLVWDRYRRNAGMVA